MVPLSRLILLAVFWLWLASSRAWPLCCPNITYKGGYPDVADCLIQCTQSVPSVLNPASYVTGEAINMTVGIALNNLGKIDELEGTATLDFYLRLSWQEPRWNLSNLFEAIAVTFPDIYSEGLDATSYALSQQEVFPIRFYRPQYQFLDAKSETMLGSMITFNADGTIFWSQHYSLSLYQPGFDYLSYPHDSQEIKLQFELYDYSISAVKLSFSSDPIDFVTYFDSDNVEKIAWYHNPLWSYVSNSEKINVLNYGVKTDGSPWFYERVEFSVKMKRIDDGIIFKLGLPILLMILLAGLSFWALRETRVDSTVTVLLSISALYIVVQSNIPLIGYLTDFDLVIFGYIFLVICVIYIHQLTMTLSLKVERYPLRKLYARLLEFMGRLMVIPTSLLLFGTNLYSKGSVAQIGLLVVGSLYIPILLVRELKGLIEEIVIVKKLLTEKIVRLATRISENKEEDLEYIGHIHYQLTSNEMLVFNILNYRRFTFRNIFRDQSLGKFNHFEDAQLGVEMNESGKSIASGVAINGNKVNNPLN